MIGDCILPGKLAYQGHGKNIKSSKASAQRSIHETVWLITSLGSEQADVARLLELARQYWCIENGTQYRLNVSAGEDRCRVRHPVATTVLGILRRAVQGEYRTWARHRRKARDSTCPAFLEKMGRRINLVIRYLIGEFSRL